MSILTRAVLGYEGLYEITNDGRVLSLARGGRAAKWLTLVTQRGYFKVSLWRNNSGINRLVSRLVLEAFVGPAPTSSHQANHINSDPKDNRVGNLEWVTPAQNSHHAIACGRRIGETARLLTFDGVTKPVGEWPRHPSLTAHTVGERIFGDGWDPALALSQPKLSNGFSRRGTSNINGLSRRQSGRLLPRGDQA